jgi:branched-chain amino acid transport system permease protein
MTGALARTGLELRRAGREARAGWSTRATIAALALGAAAVIPPATGILGPLDTLASGLYLGVAAIGLGFAVGVGGIPSLAQGAFVGIGAFTSALARLHLGLPLAGSALLGALAATTAGLLVGAATARLRRALIAVATFLLSWVGLLVFQAFPSAFGGSEGLALAPALSARGHYELALALLALSALAFAGLARGPGGLRLAAARDRPAAAAAAGVPIVRLRTGAFAFSAALAGLSGGLSVDLAGVADPSAYGPSLSFKLLAAVVIGGAAAALGGPAGIGLLGLVAFVARNATGFSDQLAARFQTMTAAVLVLLLLSAESDGVVPWIERRLPTPTPPRPRPGPTLPVRAAEAPLRGVGLSKRYGPVTALDGVDIDVTPGTVHALMGPNGSGKTTALRALAGTLRPDSGTITLGPADLTDSQVGYRVELGVVRTLQSTAVFGTLTVLENVLVGVGGRCHNGGFGRSIVATPGYRTEARAARATAWELLEAVGLTERAADRADELSATEQRLLMIATALGTDPQVLLLDEPSAGVGAAELPRLSSTILALRERGLGLLVVEHNLRLVGSIADCVSVLDAGRLIARGTPSEVASDQAVRAAYLGRHSTAQ